MLVTLAMLALYRLGHHVPIPCVDLVALQAINGSFPPSLSVLALGINPYISARILVWLGGVFAPGMRQAEQGNPNRWKRLTVGLTLLLGLFQGFWIGRWIPTIGSGGVVHLPDDFSKDQYALIVAVTLAAGAMLVLWLGDIITSHGVADGVLVIYCVELVDQLSTGLRKSLASPTEFDMVSPMAFVVAGGILLVATLVAVQGEAAARRVQIETNQTPFFGWNALWAPVYASSFMALPNTLGAFSVALRDLGRALDSDALLWNVTYALMVVGLTWTLLSPRRTAITIAKELEASGTRIGELAPGAETARFLRQRYGRLTLAYGVYIATVCVVVPSLMSFFGLAFSMGGLVIVLLVRAGLELRESLVEAQHALGA